MDRNGAYDVTFLAWDSDEDKSSVEECDLTTQYEDGGPAVVPGDALGDSVEIMASSQLHELLSPRLRRGSAGR